MTSSLETGQSFLLTPPSEPFSSKLDKPVSEMEQKKKSSGQDGEHLEWKKKP